MGLFNFRNKNNHNFRYLDDLIKSGEKNIVLDSNIVFNDKKSDFSRGIIIEDDDIVIDGNGFTVDAKGKVPIFHIKGNNLCFKNIIFKNGKCERDYGSAITVSKSCSLMISSCDFIDNVSSYSTTILNLSRLTIEESRFNNNLGKEGAAINNQGTLNVVNCEFTNNLTQTMGTIFNWNRAEILNSIFENNKARDGGAIYSTEGFLKVENSNFIKNSSSGKKEGGGAIISESKSKLSIDKCDFIENSCKNNYGGAIINYGQGTISNSLFGNNSTMIGGSINNWEHAMLVISDSEFKYNSHVSITNSGDLDLVDLNLNNFDSYDEYDIFNYGSINLIRSAELKSIIGNENGVVKDYENDWDSESNHNNFSYLEQLIKNASNEVNLESDIIIDDEEVSMFEDGILIDTFDLVVNGNGHTIDAKSKSSIFKVNGEVIFKDITFKNGFSKKYAGAIFNSYNSLSSFENCSFEGNKGENAGAIYNEGSLNFSNCEFEDNSSQNSGGVINNSSSYVTDNGIYNKDLLKFKNERKDLFEIDVSLKFTDCIFSNNTSKDKGGVLSHFVTGSVLFDNCDFLNNSSKEGGALFNSYGSISINSCTFEENSAVEGGVVSSLFGSLNIDDSTMVKSKANIGACISNSVSSIKINSSIFEQNKANESGGCIVTKTTVKNCVEVNSSIFKNNAAELAGVIMNGPLVSLDENGNEEIGDGGVVKFYSCIFENNETTRRGGGVISHFYGLLDLKDCKFENNSSATAGGAIQIIKASLRLNDSTFEKNNSNHEGGAIYSQHSSVEILNCEFMANYSEQGGVIVNYGNESHMSIDSCLVKCGDEDNDKIAIANIKGIINLKNSKICDIQNISNQGTVNILETEEEYFKKIIDGGKINFI